MQGPQGFQGRQGFQGSTGFQGAQGFQGATGQPGNQGSQGFRGATGDPGSQGAQGAIGAPGVQGAQGAPGGGGAASNLNTQAISGTTGYIIFPSDSVTGISTILQYGTVSRAGANWNEPAVITVNFPTTYPNACYSVQLTTDGFSASYDVWAQVYSIGFSSFQFLNQRSSSSAVQPNTLYYVALGY